MNRIQKKRFVGISSIVILISLALGLILFALKQNINLFYTPTQLLQSSIQAEQTVRIGGYVKSHSVRYNSSGKHIDFIVTDHTHEIRVSYSGVLPNLFRDEQGVVATGKLNEKQLFLADQVLAKHDEKYMPWPLAKALRKAS